MECVNSCAVFLCSYINQRNREWNIVESEKALVVSGNNHGEVQRSTVRYTIEWCIICRNKSVDLQEQDYTNKMASLGGSLSLPFLFNTRLLRNSVHCSTKRQIL